MERFPRFGIVQAIAYCNKLVALMVCRNDRPYMTKLSYTLGFSNLMLNESLLDFRWYFSIRNRRVRVLYSRESATTFLVFVAAATRAGVVPVSSFHNVDPQ